MNEKIKADWLVALRSDQYRQATHTMCSPSGAKCCLGVLADIIDPNGWTPFNEDQCGSAFFHHYEGEESSGCHLSDVLTELTGVSRREQNLLATMNDLGDSFLVIADHIEANPNL